MGGTLINASGGTITSLAGSGRGSRTLTAELDNRGALTSYYALNINKASAQHKNSGTISANAALTFSQSGTTPSFINSGSIVAASGQTMTINGASTFSHSGGSISGAGTLALSGLSSADFTSGVTSGGLSLSGIPAATFGSGIAAGTITLSSSTLTLGSDLTVVTALNLGGSTINGIGRKIINGSGGTINTNSSTIDTAVDNSGTLVVNPYYTTSAQRTTFTSSINGALSTAPGSLISIQARGYYQGEYNSKLVVTNGFTNNGSIELVEYDGGGCNSYCSSTLSVGGTLINSASGTITSQPGSGNGSRTLAAELDNRGALNSDYLLTISNASAQHKNSGTISVNGGNLTVSQSGTAPTFTSSGAVTIASGRTMTVSGGGSFSHSGGNMTGPGSISLSSLTSAALGAGINLSGTMTLDAITTTTFASAFTVGTLNLTGITTTFPVGAQPGILNMTGSTMTLTEDLTVVSSVSMTGSSINGVNRSVINPVGKTLNMNNSTLYTALANSGTLVINPYYTGTAQRTTFTSSINGALTTAPGSLISIQARGYYQGEYNSALNVTNGFTNNGSIELVEYDGGGCNSYCSSTLSVGGTLVNLGTINSQPGSGNGSRTLAAELDNRGALNSDYALTVSKASAQHKNSGTINVNANLTVSQSGSVPVPAFDTSGSIKIAAGKVLSVVGAGSFNQSGGSISGAGSLTLNALSSASFSSALTLGALSATTLSTVSFGSSLTLGTLTLNTITTTTMPASVSATTATLTGITATLPSGSSIGALTLDNSALTISENFTAGVSLSLTNGASINGAGFKVINPSGRSLSLDNSSIATALDNSGSMYVYRSSFVNGALTTSSGSLVRIEARGSSWGNYSSTLSVANGFINNGAIELLQNDNNGGAYVSTLSVANNGILVNSAGGRILSQTGNYSRGSRVLTAILDNQGFVTVNYPLNINKGSANHISSGTINLNANLTVSQSGSSSFANSGIINIPAGRILTVNGGAGSSLLNDTSGMLTGTGTLDVSATTFTNSGSMHPGSAGTAGTLNVTGNTVQSATGTTTIDIGGTTAGSQYDVLTASAIATLGGTLKVNLLNGFQPAVGQTYKIFTYGSRGASTTFNVKSLPTLTEGNDWNIDYISDTKAILLSVVASAGVPDVVSTIPASGAANVSTAGAISATFNRAMDPVSITANFSLKDASGSPVAGVVTYDAGTSTAIFTPSAALSGNTTYTAALTSAIKDTNSNALAPYSWSFTAAAVFPFRDEFNGAMTPDWRISNSDTSKYNLTENSGSLRIYTTSTDVWATVNNLTNQFALPLPAANGTLAMTARLSLPIPFSQDSQQGGIILYADANGQPDMDNYIRLGYQYSAANGAIVHMIPEVGGVPVPNINSPLNAGIGPVWLRLLNSGGIFSAYYSLDGVGYTKYAGPTGYPLTPAYAGLFAMAGASTPVDFDWVEVTDGPVVMDISPEAGSSGVAIGSSISAIFSDALNPATVSAPSANITLTDGYGVPVPGTASYNAASKTVIFTPLSPLAGATTYIITLGTGIKSLTDRPLGSAYSWSFTTSASAANVASWKNPVSGNWSDPANWSTGVVPDAATDVSITVNGNYTVTVDSDASVKGITLGGSSGTQTLAASGRNISINGSSTIGIRGSVSFSNCKITGTGSIANQGQLTLNGGSLANSLVNGGTLTALGTAGITGAYTSQNGSILRVDGAGAADSLTVANGFTNNGAIELTGAGAALNITSGTLTNASAATITSLPAGSGPRSLGGHAGQSGHYYC